MLTEAQVQQIFQDIGLFIRRANFYASDIPVSILAESLKCRAQLGSEDARIDTLGQALNQDRSNKTMVASLADSEWQIVDQYVRDYVQPLAQAQGVSAAEILADVAERMLEECSPAQAVVRNEVAVDGAAAADTDNAGDGTVGSIVLSQYIAAQRFTLECTDATTEGSETWSVSGSICGVIEQATTGVAYVDGNTYLQFLITAGGTAFAAGDKFYFYTTCTERKFQTFFRDRFGLVMPSVALGSETIPEAWAT